MAYAYKNLIEPQNVQSGVAEYVLLSPVSWFEQNGIMCPVLPFTNPGDEITIYEPHVFKAGKGFIKFQLAPQKNSLGYNTSGDIGSLKQNAELKIFIPGSYIVAHEAIKNLINTPLIALIKDGDCNAGLFYQLGCDCQKAWLSASFNTGTTKDGVKGYEATLTYDGGPLFYQVASGPVLLVDSDEENDENIQPPAIASFEAGVLEFTDPYSVIEPYTLNYPGFIRDVSNVRINPENSTQAFIDAEMLVPTDVYDYVRVTNNAAFVFVFDSSIPSGHVFVQELTPMVEIAVNTGTNYLAFVLYANEVPEVWEQATTVDGQSFYVFNTTIAFIAIDEINDLITALETFI